MARARKRKRNVNVGDASGIVLRDGTTVSYVQFEDGSVVAVHNDLLEPAGSCLTMFRMLNPEPELVNAAFRYTEAVEQLNTAMQTGTRADVTKAKKNVVLASTLLDETVGKKSNSTVASALGAAIAGGIGALIGTVGGGFILPAVGAAAMAGLGSWGASTIASGGSSLDEIDEELPTSRPRDVTSQSDDDQDRSLARQEARARAQRGKGKGKMSWMGGGGFTAALAANPGRGRRPVDRRGIARLKNGLS